VNSLFLRLKKKLVQSTLVLDLLGLVGKELQPDKWVFILGCYNSGTTLLNKILSTHPEIGGLPAEGIALTNHLVYPELFGWPRMWSECYDAMLKRNATLTEKDAKKIKKQWSHWYESDKSVLVEKSISDVTRIPFIQDNFTPAYFIIVRRNGYAVAEGIRRRADLQKWGNTVYEKSYPISLCAKQWLNTYKVIEEYKSNLNYLELSYEEFTSEPQKVLNQITCFLDISPFNDGILERKWSFQEITGGIKNLNGRSLKNLSEKEKQMIHDEAGDLLKRWDYDAITEDNS